MSETGDAQELEAVQMEVLTEIQALTRAGKLLWKKNSLDSFSAQATERIYARYSLKVSHPLTAEWEKLYVSVNSDLLMQLERDRGLSWKEGKKTDHEKRLVEIADDIFQRVVLEPKRKASFAALSELKDL